MNTLDKNIIKKGIRELYAEALESKNEMLAKAYKRQLEMLGMQEKRHNQIMNNFQKGLIQSVALPTGKTFKNCKSYVEYYENN